MKYVTYEKYKPSGIDWIREIPEEWSIERLKHIVADKITDGPHETPELLDEGIPFISAEAVKNNKLNFELRRGFISEKEHKKFCIKCKPRKNDIFFIKSGATTGNVAIVETDEEFSIWSPLAMIRTGDLFAPRLMLYNLLSDYFKKQVELSWSFGTQENIGMGVIQNLIVPVPPFSIQEKIVEYLDRKTVRIDMLIEKDKELIELLKEERIALINKAVTKGLDDSAKMKDSGINWIGEIPAGWEVHRLKYKTNINKNNLGDNTNPDLEIVYLDISNVDNNGNLLNFENYLYEAAPSRAKRLPELGDSIISTVRTYLRAIAFLKEMPENLVVSTGFAVLHPKDIDAEYLYYCITSEKFIQNVIANSKGIAYPAINSNDLGDLFIVCPKIETQKNIVEYIKEKLKSNHEVIRATKNRIELLEEYKKSLIYTVVTGKIKV